MRRTLKISAWTAAALMLLLVLLVGAVLIAGNTESGRAFAIRLTAQLTHDHVHLAGIGGSFPAALELQRLELRDDRGMWLFADHISLRWSPLALLARHVDVDTLHIERLHIDRAPLPDKESKPSGSTSIPHSDLAHLNVDALELGPELAGAPVSIVVRASAHVRSLQDATANISAQRSGGVGDYELRLRLDAARMDATLKLQEPAHGPLENILKIPGLGDLSVLATVQGPRNAENIQLTLDAGDLHGRAQGSVDLTNTSADLQYSLNATAVEPYPGLTWDRIDLRGRWHGPVQSAVADGHLQIRDLRIPGGTQLAALNADLKADRGLASLHAVLEALEIPGSQPKLFRDAPLTLDASVRLDDSKRPADLTVAHRLFTLHAHAMTAGDQSADLDLRVPDVAPFAAFAQQKIRGGADIKAQVKRASNKTRLTADVNASLDGGAASWAGLVRDGNTRLQLGGELTDKQIAIERLQLTGRALSLAASGTLARNATQDINARIELSLPDLASVSDALAGSLKLAGNFSGPSRALKASTDLTSTLSIHGSPTGMISASARAENLPAAPRGTLEAHGDLDGAPLALAVAIEQESKDIYHAVVHRAEWKSAHLEGDVAGGSDLAKARGTVRLRMDRLADLDRLLGSTLQGSVAGNVSLTSGRSQIQLEAHDVVAGGITTNAQLSADGTAEALNMKLGLQSPAVNGEPVSLNSAALLNLTAHELRLTSTEATYHGQTVHLLSPARLSFADGFSVADLKLGVQEAVLQLDGRVTPTLDVRASVRQVKPELINAFVPKLLASGTLQANAQIQGSFGAPTGNIQLDATGVRAVNDAARGLPGTDLHATAQLQGTAAVVAVKVTAGSASQLALNGRAPLNANGGLDLQLTGNLDLGLLNPLLEAGGRHVTGTLAIATTVQGAPAAPEIGGTVRIVKASLKDYTQGTNLSDINGTLSGEHGTLRIENLTARAAPGDVSVAGTIGVLQPKIPVDLKLTARNAQPIANNIITANLNADIHVSGTARERLDVAGTVNVKRADIEIPGGLPPNVAVLDVRRPGQAPPPVNEKPLVIALNVTVDAPRQILVKGRGLDAELGGEIRIHGTSDTPAVSGGFELQRGFFTLASSKLTFSNGNVTFNGAGLKHRIDPTLDFTAQSQVQDVTATVKITGLADAPKIELSSTPELPQDEILARLLFGEPASQLTALQVVQIGAALATLGGGGGGSSFNPVAKVQKALGLDRLSVGSASNNNTPGSNQTTGASIEAGRYVSSRVFVAVKESTTGASQLAVDVDLTKHLKLQTRLGNGTATAQGTTPENDPGSSVGVAYQFDY